MIDVSLAALPNQSLDIRLDNQLYRITVREAGGVMAADIVRDGTTVVQGARIVPGWPLIPYEYLESGNFVLVTEDDEYAYYDKFGVSQSLVYVTIAELAGLSR